jgi:elongation factor G
MPVSDVRNFVLLGHSGCGKTTLTDALLLKLGVTDRMGLVSAGTSMSDFTEEEKGRKISIFAQPFSAVAKITGGKKISVTFTDTPGYMDFYGQVISAVRASDTGVVVVDAVGGVQVGTRRVWKCCDQNGLKARAVVVTGLDRENADFAKVLEQVQSAFGAQCVPVVVPTADGKGVVDVLAAKDPSDDVAEMKSKLMELAAETDDALIEKFLGGEELTAQEMSQGLDIAVARGSLVPVFACMPLKDCGLTELLDGVERLFPPPDRVEHQDAAGKPIASAAQAPLVGLVWRAVNDPFVGQLNYVRVFGGTLKCDSEVTNAAKKQKEKVGTMLIANGKKTSPVEKANAGDIVAIPKLKITGQGDTLCELGKDIVCPAITYPKPVTFMAINAKTQADEDKIGVALSRVCDEDPTLKMDRNKETKQVVLQGLGDVHIDVTAEMMKRRSNVDVVLSTPKVPYRETVTALGEGHYKHKKQSGGRGQYGEVYLRVEPRKGGDEEWFVDAVVGGVIPGNFMPAIQKGFVEGMTNGSLAGFPVHDVKVSVYDGSYHDVDSSEIAFKIAGSRALKDGLSKARPVLLEPIMTVRVMIPEQYLGDINGDLNHRRGRILGMGLEDGMQVITADVPQSELFRYAAELRSMTGGQGTFEMEFARYDIVPSNVAQKVIAEAQKDKKDKEEE